MIAAERKAIKMKRGEILDAVKKTITQDRNNRHGEPENSFPRIAEEWTRYLDRQFPNRVDLRPYHVAEMLAIFKTCRFENQPDNRDNEHDRIGYYAIAAELREAERIKASEIQPGEGPTRIENETQRAFIWYGEPCDEVLKQGKDAVFPKPVRKDGRIAVVDEDNYGFKIYDWNDEGKGWFMVSKRRYFPRSREFTKT